jgi:AcrR family transcriptional regulator
MPKETQSHPPGRIKITEALRTLLTQKDFNAVTTAQIARTAGVTEGLIYKYFRDKKDLLHQVLAEQFRRFLEQVEQDLDTVEGALDKLSMLILSSLKSYANHRVFARMLMLEVRSAQEFFESRAYTMVRKYSAIIMEIIHQGIETNQIKAETDPDVLRQLVIGSIEHACMGALIFDKEIDPIKTAQKLTQIIFKGIEYESK